MSLTWTQHTTSASTGIFPLRYGNGVFLGLTVDGSGNSVIVRSTNGGTSWTSTVLIADTVGFINDLNYGNGYWLAVGQNAASTGALIYRSADGGQTWTQITGFPPVGATGHSGFGACCWANGLWLLTANINSPSVFNYITSVDDGVAYAIPGVFECDYFGTEDITTDGTYFITPCVISGVTVLASALISSVGTNSPSTWTTYTAPAGASLDGVPVAFGNGTYVLPDSSNETVYVASSLGGLATATPISSGLVGGDLYDVQFGTGTFVVIDSLQGASSSINNGVSWSPGTLNLTGGATALGLAFGGGTFIAGATDGDISIAAAAATTTVPNVVTDNPTAAAAALAAAGLVPGTSTYAVVAAPIGTVASQSPAAGSTVAVGSTVNLVISAAINPASVQAPNVSNTGIISTTAYTTRLVIDRAYGALGLTPQQIVGEKIQIALDLLSLVLTDLVNTANPLWCLEKILVPLVQGQKAYQMPVGTNDVNRAFYRTMFNITPASPTITPSAYTFNFGTGLGTFVFSWQIVWNGPPVPVIFQSSPDGVNWTQVYATTNLNYTWGSSTQWYDMMNTNAAQYWRVIPQVVVPANTLSIASASLYNVPNDIMMYRMNKDDYWNMTNKGFQGRPLQYWVDRQLTPTMLLWPQPDALAQQNLMVVYRQRLIMDVGSLQQVIEVPTRWFYTIIFALANELAPVTPEAKPDRIAMVAQRAPARLLNAWTEEQDKSPVKFNINLRAYTR